MVLPAVMICAGMLRASFSSGSHGEWTRERRKAPDFKENNL